MSFTLTEEQQEVVDYVKTAKDGEVILIDSVAGSGKTTLLRAVAEELGDKQGLYLAYNKSIATSSSKKFPKNIDCRTTHSLAYRATVPSLNLTVGFFSAKHITEKLSYDKKYAAAENLKEFCLSRFLTYEEYAAEYNRTDVALVNKYLTLMAQGKIDCSHDFYLKYFHKLLAEDHIEQVSYDIVMLDEAGDLNEVTLEIFKLLKSRLKVAVGDPHQNIYTFNYTINCFERLEGKTFKLSRSFRVPKHIASRVQHFCNNYLDPSMKFIGYPLTTQDIKTRGYISRTNGGLINKLIEMDKLGTPYNLVRKPQEIFKLPLIVAGFSYQGSIYDPAYRYLQDDIDDWHENVDNLRTTHNTLYNYIRTKYAEDLSLVQAIKLVNQHGSKAIFNAFNNAKDMKNKPGRLTLLTAHSSKGLEFDEVTFAPDMNLSIEELTDTFTIGDVLSDKDRESLNLYYVAATRALVQLNNARYLTY